MTQAAQNIPRYADAAQIRSLCAADFAPAIGGAVALYLYPDTGGTETGATDTGATDTGATVTGGTESGGGGQAATAIALAATLSAVYEKPWVTPPGRLRTAFALSVKIADLDIGHSGYVAIDVPGKGLAGPIYFERKLPPLDDLDGIYIKIQFN